MNEILNRRFLEASQNGAWYQHVLDGTEPPSGKREWVISRYGQTTTNNTGFWPSAHANVTYWLSPSVLNFPWLTTPETIDITTTGQDIAAGTGARQLQIIGLNSNLDYHAETIATPAVAGTVATAQSYICLNDAKVSASGNGLGNQGDIDFKFTTSTAKVLGNIPAEEGVYQFGVFGVANGYEAWVYTEATCIGIVQIGMRCFQGVYTPATGEYRLRTATNLNDDAAGVRSQYTYYGPGEIAVWGQWADGFGTTHLETSYILLRKT